MNNTRPFMYLPTPNLIFFNNFRLLMRSAFCLFIITSIGCQKEIDSTDHPPGRNVSKNNFEKMQVPLSFETINEDPVQSDQYTRNLLGSHNDTILGSTKAAIFSTFELTNRGFDSIYFQNSAIDSANLFLKFSSDESHYGNLNTTQTFNIYQLDRPINQDESYVSNATFEYDENDPIGSYTGKPDPSSGELKIKITHQSFLEKFEKASKTTLNDNGRFEDFLNGLAIVPENSFSTGQQGAILYIDLINDASNLTFYHNGTSDSILIQETSKRVNTFDNDLTPVKDLDPNRLPLKPMAGYKLRIELDALADSFANESAIINKAKFTIKPHLKFHPNLDEVPPRLLLLKPGVAFDNLPDLQENFPDLGEKYYDGNFKDSSYQINIPQHIQGLVNNDFESNGLNLIIPSDNPLIANPLIIQNNNPQTGVELELVYSKENL
ncbi:MAG: hypothetical protein BRD49_03210 [Bacteroidetes bacterium SW_10_40_5]|nr:MAG: hypothetical protein BRD49_03210 [Bacteroidetes bacterium SW_10_40_5]